MATICPILRTSWAQLHRQYTKLSSSINLGDRTICLKPKSNYSICTSNLLNTSYLRLPQRGLATNIILQQQKKDMSNDIIPQFETITLSWIEENVAHLQLNRPKTRNAFSTKSATELIDALDWLENPKTRCLILSGSGPDLTSGVDLSSFMVAWGQVNEIEDTARKSKMLLKFIETFQNPFKRLNSFSKPVICIQHGLSIGLGMELAACSDIRFCTKDVTMAVREVAIGIAADVGSLQLLPKIFNNQSLLRELIYTGRNMTLEEIQNSGFVSKICDDKQQALIDALSLAKTISQRSPVAVSGSKRNLLFSSDKPFGVGLDYNAIWNAAAMMSKDVAQSIESVITKSKEPPKFEDY